MIKGLAITPPILGRISIGRVVEKNGKRLPEKDDQFTITTQIQHKDGWLLHPFDEYLRQNVSSANGKLRSIPVRMLFDDPELNLRAEYSLFDRSTGRPICVGNGEHCQRRTAEGVQQLACPSPSLCEFAPQGHCKPYGRLTVQIEPQALEQHNGLDQAAQPTLEQDELGVFVFRTTGFNSIRTLSARLSYLQAYSGGLLSCLPLQLKLRGKSTTQSHRTPIFYVDLCIRDGLSMAQAVQLARNTFEQRHAAGLKQNQLDFAAREGFNNALFETNLEETPEVLEEFFNPQQDWYDSSLEPEEPQQVIPPTNSSLKTKLNRQLQHSSQQPTQPLQETRS
ncbi:MAG: hypothetical protein ACEQSD_01050 [Flavobacteriales bacterium]